MSQLSGRVVLITDTSTNEGYNVAFQIADEKGAVVANDETGAGTSRHAAEALALAIRRRGGAAVAAGSQSRSLRDYIEMVRVGPDKWDRLTGIIYVSRNDNGKSLSNIARAASMFMSRVGGQIVVLNPDEADAKFVRDQASELTASKLTINAVQANGDDPSSVLAWLVSAGALNYSGQIFEAASTFSVSEVGDKAESLIVTNKNSDGKKATSSSKKNEKPAAEAAPAEAAPAEAAPAEEKPAAEAAPATEEKKPTTKKPTTKKPAAKKPAAKKPTTKKPAAKKPAAKKPAAKKPSAEEKPATEEKPAAE
ncbi:MAG: hypothetical protein AAFV53_32580 [Myxococcota bacterium]